MSYNCICKTTTVVDLTSAYIQYHCNGEAIEETVDSNNSSQNATIVNAKSLVHGQLLQNFRDSGWSHVSLNLSKLAAVSNIKNNGGNNTHSPLVGEGLLDYDDWMKLKSKVLTLFEDDIVKSSSTQIPNATYRTAESGTPNDDNAEPKQSWEIRRCCKFYKKEGDSSSDHYNSRLLKKWTSALHAIASTVCEVLEFPSDILVQKEKSKDGSISRKSEKFSSCDCDCSEATLSKPCNIDLLRVFLYEPVSSSNLSLGSSPHTDWGTFTVVWQDDIGGLQTFCHSCQKWVDVHPPSLQQQEGNTECDQKWLHFVIHVGDITSIAMGNAISQCSEQQQVTTSASSQQASLLRDNSKPIVLWPSPKHRVVSPPKEKRASLVYFIYPPPGITLIHITDQLIKWCTSRGMISVDDDKERKENLLLSFQQKNVVPYDDYYILRDQSSNVSADHNNENNQIAKSSKDIFAEMKSRNLEEVFEEKWSQVQRDDAY